MEKLFFQSSLPRSGSTLLQNVMAQNPDFYCTPTSGLIELLLQARATHTNSVEAQAQDQETMKKAFSGFCAGACKGYFEGITDKKYVLDKSRGWSVTYDFAKTFIPNPKVIVMVRDLRAILSSLEKKFRQNQHIDSGIQNWAELKGTTTDKRISHFLSAPPLGPSLDIIYDSITRGLAKNFLFIKFEDFCLNPDIEVKKIYKYLELEEFNGHIFGSVEQTTKENDVFHGPLGDHKIRKKIEPVKEDWNLILGSRNSAKIKEEFDWFYSAFSYK